MIEGPVRQSQEHRRDIPNVSSTICGGQLLIIDIVDGLNDQLGYFAVP